MRGHRELNLGEKGIINPHYKQYSYLLRAQTFLKVRSATPEVFNMRGQEGAGGRFYGRSRFEKACRQKFSTLFFPKFFKKKIEKKGSEIFGDTLSRIVIDYKNDHPHPPAPSY